MSLLASNAPCWRNIEIQRGDTWSLQFQAKRPDGSIVNLSQPAPGYTIRAQIRKTQSSVEITKSFVVTIDDAAAGLFSLTLGASVTATLECKDDRTSPTSQYVYDVEITSPSGNRYTTHQGAVVVLADVTRA